MFAPSMSDCTIVFSPRAKQRLEEIAEYLYQQNLSNEFVIDYLNRFETWLETLLCQSRNQVHQFQNMAMRYAVLYTSNLRFFIV